MKSTVPNGHALRQMLRILPVLPQGRLNMATYWAEPVDPALQGVGCLLGHWVHARIWPAISLKPINFKGELKSPIMMSTLLDDYPLRQWRHHTLHYSEGRIEAFGRDAAALALRMGNWDLQTLFYPAGSSYEMRPPVQSLITRLEQYLATMPREPKRRVGAGDLLQEKEDFPK